MSTPAESYVDLYWLPVGAGTRFQRLSLVAYESVAAALGRRSRRTLLHAGLKGRMDEKPFTLEVAPAPPGPNLGQGVTGPVGVRHADRLRLFRYQVCINVQSVLPDEEWAVGSPVRLTDDSAMADRITRLARLVPPYIWGRRRSGHPEMWTSDSCVSWILAQAGIEAERIAIPEGCRAPGWLSGLREARQGSRGGS